jgi:hypothetical protein
MTKFLLVAAPLALLSACFLPRYTAKWPYRGPMIEVVNPSQEYVMLSAKDGMGRVLPLGTIAPRSKACRTWPFVDAEGQLLTEGAERKVPVESEEFNPWAFHGWRWTIGSDLEAAQVCGT